MTNEKQSPKVSKGTELDKEVGLKEDRSAMTEQDRINAEAAKANKAREAQLKAEAKEYEDEQKRRKILVETEGKQVFQDKPAPTPEVGNPFAASEPVEVDLRKAQHR